MDNRTKKEPGDAVIVFSHLREGCRCQSLELELEPPPRSTIREIITAIIVLWCDYYASTWFLTLQEKNFKILNPSFLWLY